MSDGLRPPDDLLSDLRAAGEADEAGHFTIDVAEARRKMGAFRLASPAHWLLPMVAHAVCAGADNMNVSYDIAQWRLSHDGATLSREELQRLIVLDGPAMSPALAHLSAAVDALVTLGADVDLESGDWRLRFEDGQARIDAARDPAPGVGVRIVRLANATGRGLLQRVLDAPHEERLLRDACRFAPLIVRLNDRRLPHGGMEAFALRWLVAPGEDAGGSAAQARGFEVDAAGPPSKTLAWDGGFDVRMGFVQGRGALILVVDGLAFMETDQRFESIGIECVAWPRGLELDLSYGRIVHDAAWDDVVDHLAREVPRIVVDVAEDPAPLSEGGRALLQGCLQGVSSWFTVDAALPMERASLRLFAHRADLTSLEAAEVRKLVARMDGRAESATLGRLEAEAFEAWTREGATFQRHLHEEIVDRLRAAGPSRPLIDALHRTVTRHARAMRSELALPFARQAREAAFALDEDPMLRARTLDVEAFALRCMHNADEAQRLHQRARDMRVDALAQARSDILLAEVAWVGTLPRGAEVMRRLRNARAVFASSGERLGMAEACAEIAHCRWLAGDVAGAVQAYDEAALVVSPREDPNARAARGAVAEILRKRLRGPVMFGVVGELLNGIMSVMAHGPSRPQHPALQRQHEIMEDYFLRHLYKPQRVAELLGQELLELEGSAPFSMLWLITARRLAFVYRLADRFDEADALAARIRLVIPLWPLEPA